MNTELKQKIEELLLLAKSQGVSIIGVVDTPGSDDCRIFKSIEVDCKAGTRNLDSLLMGQHCKADKACCQSCNLAKPRVSDDGLAMLFSELREEETV
ncbi:hypothetical protein [Vibrio variabilis]|nr:hypothetical protein [Vibrio variabilis]